MPKGLSLLVFLGYCTLIQSIFLTSAIAQVIPDRTTNTTVDVNGNDFTIQGGERPEGGNNLFHSFGEFSVPTDGSAFFKNAADIVNIFSRVTGGNMSNIDGLLRANGSANLFLINPAGIIFGENARLDIGGSFFGTTADSLLFDDGTEFSARDSDNPPLLTISTPIGLGLGDNPGDIVNQSITDGVGISVNEGESISLIGGNINFESGRATASGGNIELGGLSAAGTVGINEDGSLSFPEDVARADINLSNAADLDVRGTGGGSITINARNLNLKAGDSGSSLIRAGITADSTSSEAQAGDITINATDNVAVDNTDITNGVDLGAVGDAGGITINTNSLTLTNGAQVNASTSGQGNAGDLTITASGLIKATGGGSGILAQVKDTGEGNGGNIEIKTDSLLVKDGAQVLSNNSGGEGNAGSITITAEDTVTIAGVPFKFDATMGTDIASGGIGNGNDLNIKARSIYIQDDAIVAASIIEGKGENGKPAQAGNVNIKTTGDDGEVAVSNNSKVFSEVGPRSVGNGGNINITVPNANVLLENGSVLITQIKGGQGDAGNINIIARSLSVTDRAQVLSNNSGGEGNAGSITIKAEDTVTIAGFEGNRNPTVASDVSGKGIGNGNDLNIKAHSIYIRDEAIVAASIIEGKGENGKPAQSGDININAREIVSISNNSVVFSEVGRNSVGNGGGITINTGSLNLTNGGRFNVSTEGQGNAGSLTVQANSVSLDNNASIRASTQSGEGGIINLRINEDLKLKNNSFISARAFDEANGGNLNIDTRFIVGFPSRGKGNDLIATANRGNGGNININAQQIFNLQEGQAIDENGNRIPNNRNDIDASSDFGLDGTIEISEPDVNLAQEERLSTEFVDVDRLIAQNLCQRGDESEFIITGKGGMAPSPSEPRDGEISEVDLVEPAPSLEDEEEEERGEPPLEIQQASEETSEEEEIVQAQGWIINEYGKIRLVAYKTEAKVSPTELENADICHQ